MSPATESISGEIDTANNNASTNSSHTTDDTSLTNSEEKEELVNGSDRSDEDHEQEDEAEGTNHKNKDEGVTANTAKVISSGKEISSCEKMREMLDKKLTKGAPVDQQLIALNKGEMELKREMLRKLNHQEQQFNQTMKILQKKNDKIYRYRFWCITNDGCSFSAAAKQRYAPPRK